MLLRNKVRRRYVLLIIGLVCMLILLLPRDSQAQEQRVGACSDATTALDDIMTEIVTGEMEQHDLPGLTLSLVADGSVVLAKGYGFADIATQAPVNPTETLFPGGSLAKLVTWLALMQLVEAGQVALDAPVQDYLPSTVALSNRFDRPITVSDLMAHTAGFEDRIPHIFTRDSAALLSPAAYFQEMGLPRQVQAPGTFIAYCNDCAVLAAYIIEQVTGLPFETYVEEAVFAPLGMTHSTFRQDLPTDFPGTPATPYMQRNGELEPVMMEYSRQVGAGGLITTADDMARFMLAHLQEGALGGERVLDSATVAQIFGGMFAHDARLPGISYGWFEATLNGRELFFHVGDTLTFSSLIALLPDEEAGIYVSYNRATGTPRFDILYAWMDACFPAAEADMLQPVADHAQRVQNLTGVYQTNRVDASSIGKLNVLFNTRTVEAGQDGTLRLGNDAFVEIDANLFQNVNDPDDRLAFRTDADGQGAYLFVGERPNQVWRKLAWYERPVVHAIALAGALLVLLGGLGFAVVKTLRRNKTESRLVRAARWTVLLLGLSALATLCAAASWLIFTNPGEIALGYPLVIWIAVGFAVAVGLFSVLTTVLALLIWARRHGSIGGRIGHTIFAVGGLLLTSLLLYWNFIPLF